MRSGQLIGATDRIAAEVRDRAVDYREIFATLDHNAGIDGKKISLQDSAGRPQFIVDDFGPMSELI